MSPPAKPMLPPWPVFEPDEIAAVTQVLESGRVNYWTGDENARFEQSWTAYFGVKHAIALANGTLALDLALHVLGIGAGDDVLVTSRSYVASASCVAMCGARPVFADIDPDTQNVTPATLEAVRTARTRAIIVVHLAGWPCDMPAIMSFARQHGLKVIEDCAQSHNATIVIDGKPRHAGTFGDVGCFSFCQDKIMTTGGEGGMFVTDDDQLWRTAWAFKDHGKSYDAVFNRSHPPGFRWLVESIGTNWRLTEMQAAIGRLQLGKLPLWSATRRRNAAIMREALSSVPFLRVPWPEAGVEHAAYKLYAFVRPERLADGWTRDRVMNAISATGYPCFSGSCPEIYLEKAFVDRNEAPKERLPVARVLGETSLMFLVHHTIDEATMRAYASAVAGALALVPQG